MSSRRRERQRSIKVKIQKRKVQSIVICSPKNRRINLRKEQRLTISSCCIVNQRISLCSVHFSMSSIIEPRGVIRHEERVFLLPWVMYLFLYRRNKLKFTVSIDDTHAVYVKRDIFMSFTGLCKITLVCLLCRIAPLTMQLHQH